MFNFLARRLGVLMPAAKRREIDNEFTEDGDAFIRPELLEAGIDDTLGETPASERPCFGFLDLSRKRDLTSLVLVLREAPRRAEVYDHLTVASVRVWDPKHSATGQIDFAEVRETLAGLPTRFPSLTKLLVDEGAEGGSVLPWAKAQPSLALKIEGYVATPVANMQLWGALIARLHAQSISFPRHERLIAELRNLRQETFSFGSKWRVIDASRKYHRDVSLALAGACHAAGYRGYGPATATHESVREKLGDEALRDSTPRGGFFGTRSEPVARLERVAAGVTSGDDGRGRRRFWRE
jgi:hypothetical protein